MEFANEEDRCSHCFGCDQRIYDSRGCGGVHLKQEHLGNGTEPSANAADKEKACRAYAASFYESVMLRQAAANRVDGERVLAVLDSAINAFNDLLATKCGG
jgi:hypothetical protein